MAVVSKYVTEKNIKKKNRTDKIVRNIFFTCGLLSASFVVIIIVFIAFKGLKPFFVSYDGIDGTVNIFKFLTGMRWLTGSTGESALYAIGFAIIDTMLVALLALVFAVPVAVLTALFIAKIAPPKVASTFRTIVELLASIPSIIFGVFGSGIVASLVAMIATIFGMNTSGSSWITSSLVLAMMIIPTITVISENSIRSIDRSLEEGSLALGATKMQTQFKVILPAAKSGIFAGIIMGLGRALGEATAVSMVSGNSVVGITLNPFGRTNTLTSLMLIGIKETTGLDYDIRFTVGLVLMGLILITNYGLKRIMKKVGNLDES